MKELKNKKRSRSRRRPSEPLDIVAPHILPLETIYVCRWRGRGKMSVSANRPAPSRVFFSVLLALKFFYALIQGAAFKDDVFSFGGNFSQDADGLVRVHAAGWQKVKVDADHAL